MPNEYKRLDLNTELRLNKELAEQRKILDRMRRGGWGEETREVRSSKNKVKKLEQQLGFGTVTLRQGTSKVIVSAAEDRNMGQGLFTFLAPDGVSLTRFPALQRGESRLPSANSVATSTKGRWSDDVVALERAKHAPTLPVVEQMLGRSMAEVWKAIEEASAAYRQSKWTSNPKLLKETTKWVAKRPVTDLNTTLTNAAFGLPVPDGAPKGSESEWVHRHASMIQSAVSQSETLEELWDIAYWVGCELGLIDDEAPPPRRGRRPTDEEAPEGDENDEDESSEGTDSDDSEGTEGSDPDDSKEGDGEEDGEQKSDGDDEDEGTDSEGTEESEGKSKDGCSSGTNETDDDDGSDEQGTETKADGAEGDEEKDSTSEVSGSGADLNDRKNEILKSLQDALKGTEQVRQKEGQEMEPIHPHEEWVSIKAKSVPVNRSFNVQLMLDEFAGNTDVQDAFFGEPQSDLLHELRIGNLEVFEDDATTQGDIVVVVDCSGSMGHSCEQGANKYSYRVNAPVDREDPSDNGWLAWQVAAGIHSQFTDAHVIGYSTGGIRGMEGTIESALSDSEIKVKADQAQADSNFTGWNRDMMSSEWKSDRRKTLIVPVPQGHRPACVCEQGSRMGGGTPESGALLYLAQKLKSNFENAVGILITDGVPQNPARSYSLTHAMHDAGMRFGIIHIGYQATEGIYPPSITHEISSRKDLFKLSDIFQFIAMGD